MSEEPPWLAIVNPAAGRVRRAWPTLERACEDAGVALEVAMTRAAAHATDLAASAFQRGQRRFIAVGGDGTANEVLNGIPLGVERATLAVAPLGSGNDWARGLGMPRGAAAIAALLGRGRRVAHDVGRVSYQTAGGARGERRFINVAGAGYDAHVLARLPRRGPHALRYAFAVARGLPGYRAARMQLAWGAQHIDEELLVVFAAIGRYCGGGLRIAPLAANNDGLLELVAIRRLSLLAALPRLPKLYLGTLAGDPAVISGREAEIRLDAVRPTGVEADGQLLGTAPATFTLQQAAIDVIVP